MRVHTSVFLFFMLVFSCKAKDADPAGLKDDLRNTMQTYLYNAVNNDSSKVKYQVEKVIYYDDKERNIYVCQFTVQMKAKSFDTTGIMKANISKDLKKVTRIQ